MFIINNFAETSFLSCRVPANAVTSPNRPPSRECVLSAEIASLPEAVTLRYDEYEAIRLIDHQGLTQAAAAERMGISPPHLHASLRPCLPHARRRASSKGGRCASKAERSATPNAGTAASHCRRIHTGTPLLSGLPPQ